MFLNVFLIHTNHQLHQVSKAVDYFKIHSGTIIIVNFRDNQEKSVIKQFAEERNYKVINIDSWVFKDLFMYPFKHREFFKELYQIKNRSKDINLFVSQYLNDSTLIANNILKPEVFYLMDEGTASILYSGIREKNNEGKLKILVKSMIYGKLLSFPKSLTYFTKYNLKISKNTDAVIKYKEVKVNNRIVKTEEHQVYYLGSILVEMGFVEKLNYLAFLNDILQIYSNKEIYYIPHRAECSLKLRDIEELGYILKKIHVPFEMWFEAQKSIPSELASHYYATVLGNLVDLFQNLPKITAFDSPKLKSSQGNDIAHKIYLNLKDKDCITFIEL